MKPRRLALLLVLFLGLTPMAVAAQPVRAEPSMSLGLGLVASSFKELGATGLEARGMGLAGRFSMPASTWLTLDAELAVYPADLPGDRPISQHRVEGLAGVRVGGALGGVRPYARIRPGFLRVGAAPEPVPCIAIFPPPLSCVLASGKTLFVVDVGAGVEADLVGPAFLRMDAGSRLNRFPGPTWDRSGTAHDGAFWGTDLRLSVGVGVRIQPGS